MMPTAVLFENVSKQFLIQLERYRSFQDLFVGRFKRITGKRQFWALHDVSFSVDQGETVGLVGANGSGKSTVLKLISGIIQPTRGRITISGRLSALLELGAGFHPDLTGRENVYLNGSLLGLSRQEMARKFDDIVDFADLGQFIDVPVRNYSSGMHVRLGFSVAVHTDPQILLVDEVLAVGDAAFQRRCLDRIDRLRNDGVSVLLVSHDLGVVQKLCHRAIWIDRGRLLLDDTAETTVRQYLWRSCEAGAVKAPNSAERRWGSGVVTIEQVRLLDEQGVERNVFTTGSPFVVEMCYQAQRRVEQPVFGLAIHRSDGTHITGPNTRFAAYDISWVENKGTIQYRVSSLPLLEGTYYLSLAITNWDQTHIFDYHDRLYAFQVYRGDVDERYGLFTLNGEWQLDSQAEFTTNMPKSART